MAETQAKIEVKTVRAGEPFVLAFADEVLATAPGEARDMDAWGKGHHVQTYVLTILRRGV